MLDIDVEGWEQHTNQRDRFGWERVLIGQQNKRECLFIERIYSIYDTKAKIAYLDIVYKLRPIFSLFGK